MAMRANLKNVSKFVREKWHFYGSNIHSSAEFESEGRLPPRYTNDIAIDSGEDDFYCIYSYQTPIAWFAGGQWHVPNVKYSPSTSRQLHALGLDLCWNETPENSKWVRIEGQ